MKHSQYICLVLALFAQVTFSSCENKPAQIDISLDAEYSGMLAAIRGTDASLSEKLALIEQAQSSGMAGGRQVMQLILDAVGAMEGSLKEKLAAIAGAIESQALALETKMALIEAAVQSGFAGTAEQHDLLQKALASVGGSLEQKFAAVETAVSSQTTGLETIIGLIEAAINSDFANAGQARELISKKLEEIIIPENS